MANCSDCTYLDIYGGDSGGKYWCEKKCERHYATDPECGRFCRAYSRSESANRNAYNKSKDSQNNDACYLTTITCKILKMNDNNPFLNTLRTFRKNILQKEEKYKSLLVEYDLIGPIIAEHISNDPIKTQIAVSAFFAYIKPVVELIKQGKNEEAIAKYTEMTNKFKLIYSLNNIEINYKLVEDADMTKSGHGKYYVKKITE